MSIISINNLTKSYDRKRVLRGINLEIEPGQIIGYIGPNGAGKSTTVRILAGLDNHFEGEVLIDGINVKEDPLAVKKIIGYVPEVSEIYNLLTPMEFLDLIGALHGLEQDTITERATRMLSSLGLEKNLNDRMESFSKGMRQKVLIVSGLMHQPKIIFLDEPLTGLDANSVIMIKDIIAKLAADGATIFYSSHIMDVVEKISDRIILLNAGTIFADGDFATLKSKYGDTLENIFSQLTGGHLKRGDADSFFDATKQS